MAVFKVDRADSIRKQKTDSRMMGYGHNPQNQPAPAGHYGTASATGESNKMSDAAGKNGNIQGGTHGFN